ncbi:MAG: hypothetical protein GX552_10500 [Chloroflexi bacterium]|jgi:hypothetical protein|nr:hypothetical protein [Chloroflexota bacterium]
MITVDVAQCRQMAQRLDLLQVLPDEFVQRAVTPEEKRREANLWFFLVAICQSTRTLQGTLDGAWYRGWDYMVRAARRRMAETPDYFMAARLAQMDGAALRGLFSDDGVAEHSTLDRIDERVAQWHDAARLLLEQYGGDVMNLYEAAGRRLRGEGGILARLSAAQAYSDPVEKKSFLLIMFTHKCGAWQVDDLTNLKVAIDYHIMRIALRSGMVRVEDADLARQLVARQPVSAEQDNLVRVAVRDACDLLIEYSRHSVFEVDNILWMIGRNCCFYDYDPICGEHGCWRKEECSLLRGIAYACPGVCVFDGVCRGSRDAAYRAYWETTLYTHFY